MLPIWHPASHCSWSVLASKTWNKHNFHLMQLIFPFLRDMITPVFAKISYLLQCSCTPQCVLWSFHVYLQREWSGVCVVCVSSVYLPSSSFLHWQIEVNAKSSSPQCVSSSICALLHVALPVCQLFHTFTNWGQCQVQSKLIRTSLILILIHEWKIIFC